MSKLFSSTPLDQLGQKTHHHKHSERETVPLMAISEYQLIVWNGYVIWGIDFDYTTTTDIPSPAIRPPEGETEQASAQLIQDVNRRVANSSGQ